MLFNRHFPATVLGYLQLSTLGVRYKKADVQADMVYLKEVKQDPGGPENVASGVHGLGYFWATVGSEVSFSFSFFKHVFCCGVGVMDET